MTASLMPVPKQAFFGTVAGVFGPIVDGYVYFYESGTVTPKDAYTTAAGSTPTANPIRLNARGEPSTGVFLGSGAYTVKLCDALNAEVWTQDGVKTLANAASIEYTPASGPDKTVEQHLRDLTAQGGSAIIGFISDRSGGVARTISSKLLDVVSVKDFGAVGDGVTDDSASIQSALNAIETTGVQTTGALLWFPPGLYLVSQTLTTGLGGRLGRVSIRGAGTSTRIIAAPLMNADLFAPKNGQFTCEDVFFDGSKSTNTSGSCVYLDNTSEFVVFKNCEFRLSADYGVKTTGGNQQLFLNCRFMGNHRGAYSTNNMALDFVCCTFEDNYDIGLEINGSSSDQLINVNGCYFENNADNGSGVVAEGCHIQYSAMQDKHKLNVTGSYFNGEQSAAYQWGVRLTEGTSISGVNITGNHFNDNTLGSFDITSTAANVGLNDLRNNHYQATTGPTRQIGFLLDDSFHGALLTESLDLSAGTRTAGVLYTQGRPLRITKLQEIYTEASSADAGTTLNVGYNGNANYFYSGTSAVSQALFAATDRTSSLTTALLVSDKMIVINSAGAKVGTGEVAFNIEYTLF